MKNNNIKDYTVLNDFKKVLTNVNLYKKYKDYENKTTIEFEGEIYSIWLSDYSTIAQVKHMASNIWANSDDDIVSSSERYTVSQIMKDNEIYSKCLWIAKKFQKDWIDEAKKEYDKTWIK